MACDNLAYRMADLIAQIRARIESPAGPIDDTGTRLKRFPPATPTNVRNAEAAIGRELPGFLGQLYTEVANGGFGPDYGLLGIDGGAGNEGGHDATAIYLAYREPDPGDRHWRWPTHLLPVVHCGCAMYLCVHCRADDAPMTWFEPNPHMAGEPWDESFIPLTCNLEQLMSAWLRGESWIDHFTPEAYRP